MTKQQNLNLSKQNLSLQMANISIILDNYDDIFSDFDPRPYSERALSHDFLRECKKASIDKDDTGLELRLMIPKDKRNFATELLIRKRLKAHFLKHYDLKKKN